MLCDDLLTTISGQTGCGTKDVDLFAGELPDGNAVADLATQMIEYGGPESENRFGAAGVWRERPRVQFMTRSAPRDYAGGRSRLETIKAYISALNVPMQLGGVQYYVIKMLTPVWWMRRDEKWRNYFVLNVEFYKDPAA